MEYFEKVMEYFLKVVGYWLIHTDTDKYTCFYGFITRTVRARYARGFSENICIICISVSFMYSDDAKIVKSERKTK